MSGPRLQSEDEEYFEKPGAPGTSIKFAGGKPFRRYLLHYAIGLTGLFMLMGAVGGILLPNQVQDIEFGKYFTGADAGVSLQDLDNLKADVDEGVVTPSAEDQRLLDKFEDFDAGRARSLSIVQSVALFLTMFVQPLAGVLSDRTRSKWGRRAPWIAGGAVIGALLLIGLRNSSTIALMAACWAGAQLFINVCIVPMTASVADRVSEKKIGAASAISGLGAMFGAALGAVGAGVLFSSMGLDTYYPFAVILVVLPVLFVLAQRDETSMDLEVPPISWRDLLKSFVIPLRDRDFRWVWIAKVAMMFGYSISILYSIYMMQSYIRPSLSAEEATRTAPLLQVAALPCMLVAMVVAGRWSDRVRRRKPFVFWASILMALSMLVPLVWPSLPALFIQAVVSGIALGTFIVVDQALFIEVIPDKSFAGRDLGMSTLASNLGQGIGPVVSGQIVALAGGYRGIWVMAAAVVVVAAIAITPVKRAR